MGSTNRTGRDKNMDLNPVDESDMSCPGCSWVLIDDAEDALVDKSELNTEFSNPQAITAVLESSILSMRKIEPYMASCIRGPAELAA